MTATADLTPDDDRPRVSDPAGLGPGEEYEHLIGPIPKEAIGPEPVTEEEIRRALGFVGRSTHRLAGHPEIPEHWDFTPDETDDLAGPLTGLVNRFDWLAAFVRRGDLIILVVTLIAWVGRNRRITAEIEEYAAAEPERPPITETQTPIQPWDQV